MDGTRRKGLAAEKGRSRRVMAVTRRLSSRYGEPRNER